MLCRMSPYAATQRYRATATLYYISTSLSLWLSWPRGLKRYGPSAARASVIGRRLRVVPVALVPLRPPPARIQLFRHPVQMPIGFKDITYPVFYSNRGHQRRLRRPTTVSAFSNFHLSSCRGCFEIFVLYNGQQGLQHVPLGAD